MCQIDSVPKASISWEKNKQLLPHNKRFLLTDSGDLYITATQLSDEGFYRCIANNSEIKKQRISSEGLLTVVPRTTNPTQRPPSFLDQSTTHELVLGSNYTFICAAQGYPLPDLTWSFNGHKIGNKSKGVAILQLKNVSQSQGGIYSCLASSLSTNQVLQQNISVEVLEPPTVSLLPAHRNQSTPTAKTVRFNCERNGVPKPHVTWFKDGKELQINGRIKVRLNELLVSNTITDDSGIYQCVAVNKAGEAWAAGRLVVDASPTKPSAPTNVKCQTLSAAQVKISWDEPSSPLMEEITAYTVHHEETDGGEERNNVVKNRTFVVDKLTPFTNYTFKIRAYVIRGASDFSENVICQTGEAVPIAAPAVTLNATSDTTLKVSWEPLPIPKARGVIVKYKVQWRKQWQMSSNVQEVEGDLLEYIITGLDSGKTYEVRVLAKTSKGWPPDSADDHFQWLPIDMPNGPTNVPIEVHLHVVNSTSIEVKWSLPQDDEYNPDGFKLYHRNKLSSHKTDPFYLYPNMTEHLIGNLEPDTLYEVHVIAFTRTAGDGREGVASVQMPPASELTWRWLEPPTNLEAQPTSSTSINLTWTPPAGASNVSFYVSYNPVQGSSESSNFSANYVVGYGSGVEVKHLKPSTLYEFKVRTQDKNDRHGPFSQKLEVQTLEDIPPSKIRNLQWKSINSTTVHISWKEPLKTSGIVSEYVVQVTSNLEPFRERDKSRKLYVPGTQTFAEVTGFSPNTHYRVSVSAKTLVGESPPESIILSIYVPLETEVSEPPPAIDYVSDHHLGISIGLGIGLLSILLCISYVTCRYKCLKSPRARHATNGNGCYEDNQLQETQFMSVVPINVPTEPHLDTKGGYPNGQVNGLKHPLLSNGRAIRPIGLRDKSSVHITENPHYKCTDGMLIFDENAQPTESFHARGFSGIDHTTPLLEQSHLQRHDSGPVSDHQSGEELLDITQVTQVDMSLTDSTILAAHHNVNGIDNTGTTSQFSSSFSHSSNDSLRNPLESKVLGANEV